MLQEKMSVSISWGSVLTSKHSLAEFQLDLRLIHSVD